MAVCLYIYKLIKKVHQNPSHLISIQTSDTPLINVNMSITEASNPKHKPTQTQLEDNNDSTAKWRRKTTNHHYHRSKKRG